MSEGQPRSGSLRARLLGRFLRRVMKPRTVHLPEVMASRAFVDRYTLPWLPGIRIRPGTVGGIPGEWVTARRRGPKRRGPKRREPDRTLLYLHGGAFAICSPATYRPVTAAFARRGFRVFAPAYRLAPEHRFPAALEDAVSACRGLYGEGTDPAGLAIAGDSAGGNLVLTCMLRMRELGVALPAAAVLFSPWTDLACTGRSLVTNAERDVLFHPTHVATVARAYLGTADPTDPLASPLYADLAGLPPLLVQAGEDEIMLDDSRRIAERARAAGLEVALEVFPAVCHGWQLAGSLLPEARRSLDAAAAFLRERTTPGAGGRA